MLLLQLPNEPTSLSNLWDVFRGLMPSLPSLSGPPGPVAVPPASGAPIPSIPVPPEPSTSGKFIDTRTGKERKDLKEPKPKSPSAATRPPATPPPLGPASLSDLDRKKAEAEASIVRSADANQPDLSSLGVGDAGRRWMEGIAPAAQRQAPGERRDFSAREAEIQGMMKGPEGFWNNFADAYIRLHSPEVARARDAERNARVELAQRALEEEQKDSDEDFRRQEAIKDQLYLSEMGSHVGKQYYTDTQTGLSGWYSPQEIQSLQLKEQELALQREGLAGRADYMKALADQARAQAEYTGTVRGTIGQDAQRRLALQSIIEGDPMGMHPETAAARAELARMAGVGGAGAAAPPPYTPQTEIGRAAESIIPGAGQTFDNIRTATQKDAVLKWIQNNTELSAQQKQQLSSLLSQ